MENQPNNIFKIDLKFEENQKNFDFNNQNMKNHVAKLETQFAGVEKIIKDLNENFELEAHDFYLDLENQPSAFFTYTPELFRALIGDICQDKNLQIEKAQLYNIPLRAKTDYKFYDRFAFEDMELPLKKLESYYDKAIGCGSYKLNKIQLSELFK